MRVLYVNKRSALFGLLLALFIIVSGYSLLSGLARVPEAPDPALTAGDSSIEGLQQVDLLPALPDLNMQESFNRQEFFVESRLARDRIRSQQMETLREIASQPTSSGEIRDSAQRELMQISENMTRETELEKLVMARGFNDAAVMILPQSATVVVQVRSIAPADVDQIKTLVAKTTGLDGGSVFVIPRP